jgi:hypothetical protein
MLQLRAPLLRARLAARVGFTSRTRRRRRRRRGRSAGQGLRTFCTVSVKPILWTVSKIWEALSICWAA